MKPPEIKARQTGTQLPGAPGSFTAKQPGTLAHREHKSNPISQFIVGTAEGISLRDLCRRYLGEGLEHPPAADDGKTGW
jgi:hypothetical protein